MQDANALPHRTRREQTPEEWVTEQLTFTTEEGARVYKFRVEARNRDSERFRPLVAVLRQPKETRESLFNKLDLQAARCQSPQVQITAWLKQSTKQPIGIFLWPVEYQIDDDDDNGDDGDDGNDTVGKTVPAMYRQIAKHNETLMGAMMRNCQSTLMHLAGQNERFEGERTALMREREETFHALKQLHDSEDDRIQKSDRWAKLGETFKTIAEATAFRITQGKVAPDAKSSVLLRSLAMLRDSLTPEQAMGLQKLLTANQLTLFATLITEPEEYAARAVNTADAPQPTPEPAAPATSAKTSESSTNQAQPSRKKAPKKKTVAKLKSKHKTR